jgi:flagellin
MQTLTFTGLDSTGAPKVATVNLTGGTTGLTASQAADAINTALQATDNPALKSIVAVADAAGGGITFAGSNTSQFTVTFGAQTGTSANTTGFNANNTSIRTSTASTGGGTADITNQGSAQAAVSALAAAVTVLGTAQANVGKGENTFNYAMNLAQSQTTNLAASESRIRDADLASEAANLTKAQILIQAGTAALAQANTAPQAILSLLKG